MKIRNIIAWLFLVSGFAAGIYFGGGTIINAITACCQALDAKLFGWTIAWMTFLKCIKGVIDGLFLALLGFVGYGIVYKD